jgi:transcriptional regulator with XRE-family HTH domain
MTLKQIFISNLKKIRKERGFSQMALSLICDTTSNYIGQIEMGRRSPSFEKIEKIASALGIASYELFEHEKDEKKLKTKPKTKDYLIKMPTEVKKEIISRLLSEIKKDVNNSFDLKNY